MDRPALGRGSLFLLLLTIPNTTMRFLCIHGSALLCAVLLTASASYAQEPFSRISAAAGTVHSVHRTALHDFWTAGRGGELLLSTPFHAGEIELGLALHRYGALDDEVPRFDALLTSLGWRIDVSPWEFASLYGGFDVGNYRMSFDEETFAGVRTESELTLGLNTRLELRCSQLIRLYAAARTLRVYTKPRLPMAYGSAGLRITLDSPDWLTTILR